MAAGGARRVSEDRKLEVLRAIVEDYVSTQEPVGSKALVERHNLGVSPATIRNDMAALEDEGYIAQPHTSAGPHPHRQGLPAVRRPALDGQAAVHARASRDPVVPRRRRRPRRHRRAHRPAARPAHPPGGGRPVPLAHPVQRAPRRAGHPQRRPGSCVVLITNTGRVEQRVVEMPGSRGGQPARRAARAAQRRRRRRAPRRRAGPARPSCPTASPCPTGRRDGGHRRSAGDARRAAGGARGHGRGREPGPVRPRLPAQHPAGARGARGAGRAAAAAR